MKDFSLDGILKPKAAVNAAVEAAWAGESNKGLAVVADELQKLAEWAKKASTEINEQLDSSIENERTVEGLLAASVPLFQKAATLMLEIRAASGELRSGVEQIQKAHTQNDHMKRNISRITRGDGAEDKREKQH